MKHAIIILTAFCFCTITFSQENSLFSYQDQGLWENQTIKKNDSSLLYNQLFKDKTLSTNSVLPLDYQLIYEQYAFNKSENSAIKHVMPIYKPNGKFKHKNIFPDTSMYHLLLIKPVKER